VERNFYEGFASQVDTEIARMPRTYAHVWNDAGTEGLTIMEDVSHRSMSGHSTGAPLSMRHVLGHCEARCR
jgi:hypothetical protein